MKLKPIDVTVPWLPGIAAITLWPFCLYREGKRDTCTEVHEYYHWHDALRWGVVSWYIAYLLVGIRYIGRPAREHPLEIRAYQAEDECRRTTP